MEKRKITINIPEIFVSVNCQYLFAPVVSQKRVVLTKLARAYKDSVGWTAKNAYKGDLILGPVKVSIWYWFPDHRRRDVQNDKITLDALENIIYKNDSQIRELHLYKRLDKEGARTKIIIEEL